MKSLATYLNFILLVLFLSMKSDNDKKDLLCHRWVQFAFKQNGASSPHDVDNGMIKECLFNADGSYKESMYNNMLKSEGQWFLNNDQTKMEFILTNINGQNIPPFQEKTRHYNIIILKLNKDTLIYGQEAYYGKDGVYGHDDWYFVRKD